jgi:transcriptional regulator with XRE-family HTH domain
MSLNLEILHAALTASRKSQADIAKELGVSKATVSRWFSGQGEPETVERLRQLAAALEISLAAMCGEDAAINERERLLLKIYREQDPMQADALLAMLAAFTKSRPGSS